MNNHLIDSVLTHQGKQALQRRAVRVAPEAPSSSNRSSTAIHPRTLWDSMYKRQTSYWTWQL